jgi:hypothetical protein
LKGKIDFVPSGCSGETVGSLRCSDALVYCGNADPAVISADNALELLSAVIGSGSTGPVLSTASATGARQTTPNTVASAGLGSLAQRLAGQLFKPGLYADANPASPSLATQADAGLPVQAASISINESEPCDNNDGILSLKGKLSNQGIGSLNLVFHDCLLEGGVFNGSAKLTISAFDLGYLTFTDAVLDFTMLSSSGVSGDILLSGTMRDQLDMAADTETLTLDLVILDNAADRAYRAEGVVVTTVYDNWQNPHSYNETINGRVYDSTHGYVDATTLQPLAYSSLLQPYPDQGGSLSLTGASDSTIRFTVLSTTTASLAVDTDGDGVAEYANTINTSAINGDTGTPAAPVAGESAYPPSTVITDIVFDMSTLKNGAPGNGVSAPGSDNWAITWSGDDHQYAVFGDGRGFSTFNKARASNGVARIEGGKDNYSAFDVFKTGGGSGGWGGKSLGILALGTELYMFRNGTGSEAGAFQQTELYHSTDNGSSWDYTGVCWDSGEFSGSGTIYSPTFLQFGKGYAGARDSYVYIYANEVTSGGWNVQRPGRISLLRVPGDSLNDKSDYKYFSGLNTNNSPTWSSAYSDRVPVFSDQANGTMRTSVSYNAGLGRYLLTTQQVNRFQANGYHIGLYEAPEPWGPWRTVLFDNPADVGPGLNTGSKTVYWNFSNKWLSNGGKNFVMVYTGPGEDEWGTVEGRFVTSPDNTSP